MLSSRTFVRAFGLLAVLCSAYGCSSTSLDPWHTERLVEEYTASMEGQDFGFDDYLALEERLLRELQEKVYSKTDTGPEYALARYSTGSAADPHSYRTNWNRTFEIKQNQPAGGVLLLHGMSDSPYSLRALALTLGEKGFYVIGLRLPGHGTAPSGLRRVRPADMTAAVRLAMAHLAEQVGAAPLHIIGYSTGASLALNHALDAADDLVSPMPASLLLISPAIRVHGTASLAGFKDTLGAVPGMGGMNWLTIMPEFDPFKYNSFATNAGDVVHQLTRTVDRRIAAHAAAGTTIELPPIIAFKSTVDATVSTEAIVDNLLMRLSPGRSELVLFDINRMAAKATLLIGDPGPLTTRLLAEDSLPFGLTIVGNVGTDSRQVSALYRPPQSTGLVATELPEGQWPDYVYSLSHIALPIPADDPLYGTVRPDDPDSLFLGEIAMRGERGIYKIPADWLVRMRYNPFYDILEARAIEWIENAP